MGPGTTSHANNLSLTAFVDVLRQGLMASDADLPSRCAAPFPISEEDRLAVLDSSPWVADRSGPSPCANQQNMEARTSSRIGELRRNIAEMQSQFEAIRSRSASPPLPLPVTSILGVGFLKTFGDPNGGKRSVCPTHTIRGVSDVKATAPVGSGLLFMDLEASLLESDDPAVMMGCDPDGPCCYALVLVMLDDVACRMITIGTGAGCGIYLLHSDIGRDAYSQASYYWGRIARDAVGVLLSTEPPRSSSPMVFSLGKLKMHKCPLRAVHVPLVYNPRIWQLHPFLPGLMLSSLEEEASVEVEVQYPGKFLNSSSGRLNGHKIGLSKESCPTGSILEGPHPRVAHPSPKRIQPKEILQNALGDINIEPQIATSYEQVYCCGRPDQAPSPVEVAVSLVVPAVQDDQITPDKPKHETVKVDGEHSNSPHQMKLVMRDGKENYSALSKFSRIRDNSELHQPPSVDAVTSKPYMEEACISQDAKDSKLLRVQDLLQSASYAASAPEAIGLSDNMASCNGPCSCLMKVVPIGSSSTQSVACNFDTTMETSSSIGMPLSDELPTVAGLGNVPIDAGPNARSEQMLSSCSESPPDSLEMQESVCILPMKQCLLNKIEMQHPVVDFITVSYADITRHGPVSIQPIFDEDRLAPLGISYSHDVDVESPIIGYYDHVVPADQLGGEQRPCTSIATLRRNIV
ncbi:hypothetical protein Nepgr_016462 [Nepenthes gracilis]|uniref:Uncharacterized protein n=1 Tax=Nepenthes gracilis TaxID=150966 RepID=A0AAD3SQE3_NEPGR|nr:hypothetical protein Nepgr_016462 [Nepenthes gracilis]